MNAVMRELDPQAGNQPEPKELQLAEAVSEEAMHLSALPINEIEDKIREGQDTLDALTKQLSDAQRHYEQTTHPSRYTSPDAHAVALRDHLPTLLATEAYVRDATTTLCDAARVLDEATAYDREPTLSDTDMNRASAAREFVKENCDTLTLREIRAAVQHTLQTNDAAQSWLYLRYGMHRLGDHRETDRNSSSDAEGLRVLLANVKDRMLDKRSRDTNLRAKELKLAAFQLQARAKARQTTTFYNEMAQRLRSHV